VEEEIVKIWVAERCGPICVDPEDGDRLCLEASQALLAGESVCLDFAGVSTLTSSFLNAAVGCLYGKLAIEDLASRLTWTGLDETDESVLRLVCNNAARYFKHVLADDMDLLSFSGITVYTANRTAITDAAAAGKLLK
jgi:hypothetical protein